jgi:hypothetical protein
MAQLYRSGFEYRNGGTYRGSAFTPPTPSKVDAFNAGRQTVGGYVPAKISVIRSNPSEVRVNRFDYL